MSVSWAVGKMRGHGSAIPERAIFWGTINPLEGRKALDLMERQVKDYGARAFKLKNVRYDYGEPCPWRMDAPPGSRTPSSKRPWNWA